MKSHDRIIHQMKTAAEQQNWDLYLEAIEAVVCEINKDLLVDLLVSHVHIFMLKFVETEPQYQSEYEKSFIYNSNEMKSDYLLGVTRILEQHKGESGINNAIRGISKLLKLLALDYCEDDFVENFLSSLTNLLIAIPSRSWGIQNPALYSQWLHGKSNDDLLILAKHYAPDPEKIQESKTLWNQCANKIELLLQSGSE